MNQATYVVDRALVTAVFLDMVDSFCDVVARATGAASLDGPGLGEWSLRDLVGHAGRALGTTTEYLTDTAPPDAHHAVTPDGVDLGRDEDPVGGCGAYFLFTTARPELAKDVAERGREAGRALGGDPSSAVAGMGRAARQA
ncbi:MAG TPA: hypothetical protein VE991_03700, partial [Acidimicrobiales bacterium]|nr:hypothetical protein [Acidimicrobiales bacterium]